MAIKTGHGNHDPNYTVIIVGDDGESYKITKDVWQKDEYKLTVVENSVVSQLTKWGSYLAFIPPKLAIGFGSICTVVNLDSILKNQSGNATGDKATTPPGK